MPGFVQAVAVDLDGTIAHDGEVTPTVLAAIDDCRDSGTVTILVTGRIEAELEHDFLGLLSHFDAAVLENGALLSLDGRRNALARLDPLLASHLRKTIPSLREGAAILACSLTDMPAVLEGIDLLGLDAQLVHNRAELMVLPAGVSKGTGMRAALAELGISAHNCVAIGDAENDLAMLSAAEIAVAAPGAVASAVRAADIVLSGADGDGVSDFLRGPVVSGAQPVHAARHDLRIGVATDGSTVTIPGAQAGILVCGGSGAGKSHLTGLLVERWIDTGYTVLIIDPEGDHTSLSTLRQTVVIDAGGERSVDGLLSLLGHQFVSVVLDLSRLDRAAAVSYLAMVAPRVESLRNQSGLPHWIVIDEAHGVMGDGASLASVFRPNSGGYCYVTYHPEMLCAAAKTTIDITLTALGSSQGGGGGTAAIRIDGRTETVFVPDHRVTAHVRHRNKYRDITLPPNLRFRFRDSSGREIASAETVRQFVGQLSSVADDSVVHHALRGDFSRWAVGAVQDRALGSLLAGFENECAAKITIAANGVRQRVETAVAQRYGLDDDAAIATPH
jgi:hydroxymethylpyrimidine pyrophosphatase-like HAD family hydrolase